MPKNNNAMKKKSILFLLLTVLGSFLLFAEENPNNEPTKKKSDKRALEFSRTKNLKNNHYGDSGSQLIGEIGDGVLSLDFSEFEGTAQVKCKDLVTGDQCTYSTTANGTSYQYIGDVSGVLQITVTTAESSYECITVVE